MTELNQWAARWNLPPQALEELRVALGSPIPTGPPVDPEASEAGVQQRLRLLASKLGTRLWRNNNGAFKDDSGRLIRYGLANDSSAVSKRLKSSDLIGITPHLVTQADVGRTLGIFTSIEVKRGNWTYSELKGGEAGDRERAQNRWNNLVVSLGGYAGFASHEDALLTITHKRP